MQKRLYGLSDEQIKFQLMDRTSFKRLEGLELSCAISDRTTIWLLATARAAEVAQHVHCPHPHLGRARVRCDLSDGRQDDPHRRTSKHRLRSHPDGRLRQHS